MHEDDFVYLTVKEAAALLRLSPKRLRNMMSAGVLKRGNHYVRPEGLGPRFIASRLHAWLRGEETREADPIPMARDRRLRAARNGRG